MTPVQVDEWLDEYNDYLLLYELFGDKAYLDETTKILTNLKRYISRLHMYKKRMFMDDSRNVLQK
ncbi:hypothetical protein QFZ77_003050 [Paenibacillus sp. V4I3]|uniref:hypothetical protein n=1 Tax=unclassified Paenibacillus TaxID=185978 RepID=UPI00277E8518|nr:MULTISPECIES: hypothetical protein [unclassified Paenibacillus]MDQ0874391.1 hypothetical protein [Paenibacillus sp. V4I3]MDQ0889892.1 hypothetical protein [Paenibacillus sp. V4I9]